MIRLRPYVAGDALLVELRPELAAEASGQDLLGYGVPVGRAWTLTQAGRVVACGGLAPDGAGRAAAWTLMGALGEATGLAAARACRRMLASWGGEFRRIEARTRADFPAGADFLHWLGFEFEGVARAWGPDGADYIVYARVQ